LSTLICLKPSLPVLLHSMLTTIWWNGRTSIYGRSIRTLPSTDVRTQY